MMDSVISTIALQCGDKIIGIKCLDGKWLSNNGVILQNYYKTSDKVRKLIDLGDVKLLGNIVELPGGMCSQNIPRVANGFSLHPESTFTISYQREEGCRDGRHDAFTTTADKWLKNADEESLNYLFDSSYQKWFVCKVVRANMFQKSILKYDLDRLLTDEMYLCNFYIQSRCKDAQDAFKFDLHNIKVMQEQIDTPILGVYNKFLLDAGVTDAEFDISKDENGKMVYALFNKLEPGQRRRKVIAKHQYINFLLGIAVMQEGII